MSFFCVLYINTDIHGLPKAWRMSFALRFSKLFSFIVNIIFVHFECTKTKWIWSSLNAGHNYYPLVRVCVSFTNFLTFLPIVYAIDQMKPVWQNESAESNPAESGTSCCYATLKSEPERQQVFRADPFCRPYGTGVRLIPRLSSQFDVAKSLEDREAYVTTSPTYRSPMKLKFLKNKITLPPKRVPPPIGPCQKFALWRTIIPALRRISHRAFECRPTSAQWHAEKMIDGRCEQQRLQVILNVRFVFFNRFFVRLFEKRYEYYMA